MLASAAICGFKVIRGGNKILNGRVRNKEEAQKEYDEAVKAGKTAAIGKEITKDIFTICVGQVAPNETITVQLSYINTLIDQGGVRKTADDEQPVPQLRFTVPRAYVQRYGATPSGEIDQGLKENIHFHFTLDIQQVGDIINIQTPEGVVTPDKGSKTATITFDSDDITILPNSDIVIIITAKGLNKPRAFMEPHPSPSRSTTAIALSWMPDLGSTVYQLTPPPEMEYLILLDRSDTMKGAKMAAVKGTLQLLLRRLSSRSRFYPHMAYPDAYFNIISYGKTTKKLWLSSEKAGSNSIDKAIVALEEMKADMGEKDILSVLRVAFTSLKTTESQNRPVSIFLLTDGAMFDVQGCMRYVRDQIIERQETIRKLLGQCPPAKETFLRVFTIGLGHGVSTELCDSVARAGGGYSTYITQYTSQEDVLGRIQRLVAASQMPPIVSDFKFSSDTTESQSLTNPNAWGNREAPKVLPNVFPYTRSNAYKISGTTGESGTLEISSVVPSRIDIRLSPFKIHVAKLPSSKAPFIHVCAAKAIITDYEDALYLASFPNDVEEIKQEINIVGILYQITSRYTSFVVVDDGTTVGASQEVFNYIPDHTRKNPERGHGPVKKKLFATPDSHLLEAGDDAEGTSEPGALPILQQLIQLQQPNGSFGPSSRTAIELIMKNIPSTAYTGLADAGYGDEVIAVLLTHSWITLKYPDEGLDTQILADQWLESNAESVDVEAIHSYLSQSIT